MTKLLSLQRLKHGFVMLGLLAAVCLIASTIGMLHVALVLAKRVRALCHWILPLPRDPFGVDMSR